MDKTSGTPESRWIKLLRAIDAHLTAPGWLVMNNKQREEWCKDHPEHVVPVGKRE